MGGGAGDHGHVARRSGLDSLSCSNILTLWVLGGGRHFDLQDSAMWGKLPRSGLG